MPHPNEQSSNPTPRPPRRKRYSGTHPREFQQRYKELDPQRYPDEQEHVRAQGRTPAGTHVPVLVEEVLAAVRPAAGEIAADCTLGFGGHAEALLRRVGPSGRVVGFDVDREQLERTSARLRAAGCGDSFLALHSNFAGLAKGLERLAQAGTVVAGYDVVLADLGASSIQLDDPRRGFSYKHDGPLDMRMDARRPRSAADLLARLSAEELSEALRALADEPDHAAIAGEVVRRRSHAPLRTTLELARLVMDVKRAAARHSRGARDDDDAPHPAARTFQALRILVNDELAALDELLRVAPAVLAPGGRLGVISFHSGEDRRVKHALRRGVEQGLWMEVCDDPVRPSAGELRANPRSRPARFRWAIRAASDAEGR